MALSKDLEKMINGLRQKGANYTTPSGADNPMMEGMRMVQQGNNVPSLRPMDQEYAQERARQRGPMEEVPGFFGQIARVPGQMSNNVDNFLGTFMRAATPREKLGYTPPSAGDVLATAGIRSAEGEIIGSPGRTEAITGSSQRATSIPPAQPAEQTPVPLGPALPQQQTPTIPTGQAGSPQANFAERMASGKPLTPEEIEQANQLAASMGTTFNPETGYDRQPFLDSQQQTAPQGSGLTTVGGIPLNQFLSGEAIPERNLQPQADFLTQRMAPQGAAFEQASQERQLGIGGTGSYAGDSAQRNASIQFAQGPRPARGPDSRGMSERDAMGLTQGDRRNILREQGIGGSAQVAFAKQAGQNQAQAMTPQEQANLQRTQAQTQTEQLRQAQILQGLQQNAQKVDEQQRESYSKDADRLAQVFADTQRIQEIGERAGLAAAKGEAGLSGWLLNFVPGSSARDFRGDINTLAADSAFSALKAMKEASPTGGALGQVTERELELLRDAQVALDPNMSDERVASNVKRYLNLRNQIMQKAYRGFVREYGENVANQVLQGASSDSSQQAQSWGTVNYQGSDYEIVD